MLCNAMHCCDGKVVQYIVVSTVLTELTEQCRQSSAVQVEDEDTVRVEDSRWQCYGGR